jgi:hypothetical protein
VGAQDGDKSMLRYRFAEGEKVPCRLEQKVTADLYPLGRQQHHTFTHVMHLTRRATPAKDGTFALSYTLDRLEFRWESPGTEVKFDSRDGTAGASEDLKPYVDALKSLVGSEFSVTMTPLGEVREVKLPEGYRKGLFAFYSAGGGIGNEFSEDNISRLFGLTTLVLPEGPVGKGDTWSAKLRGPIPGGQLVADVKYTHEGAAEGGKRIKVAGKPTLSFALKEGAPVQPTLKSAEGKTAAVFEPAAGRLVESVVTQKLEFTLGPVAQKIDSTFTFKLAPNE